MCRPGHGPAARPGCSRSGPASCRTRRAARRRGRDAPVDDHPAGTVLPAGRCHCGYRTARVDNFPPVPPFRAIKGRTVLNDRERARSALDRAVSRRPQGRFGHGRRTTPTRVGNLISCAWVCSTSVPTPSISSWWTRIVVGIRPR
jgi:hypothetical protein